MLWILGESLLGLCYCWFKKLHKKCWERTASFAVKKIARGANSKADCCKIEWAQGRNLEKRNWSRASITTTRFGKTESAKTLSLVEVEAVEVTWSSEKIESNQRVAGEFQAIEVGPLKQETSIAC